MKKAKKNKHSVIKTIVSKIKSATAPVVSHLKEHKIQTLQTAMLIHLIIRVEMIYAMLNRFGELLFSLLLMLSTEVEQAALQFKLAILSILSLFGGSPS